MAFAGVVQLSNIYKYNYKFRVLGFYKTIGTILSYIVCHEHAGNINKNEPMCDLTQKIGGFAKFRHKPSTVDVQEVANYL
jgi:hypothetical protein